MRERLQPALLDGLATPTRHGHLAGIDPAVIDRVRSILPATIDRRLADVRMGLVASEGPRPQTGPGDFEGTDNDEDLARVGRTSPGFLQIDLVGHEGGDSNGQFHYSIDSTDIATGWTES